MVSGFEIVVERFGLKGVKFVKFCVDCDEKEWL